MSRICNEEHNAYEYKEEENKDKNPTQFEASQTAEEQALRAANEEIRILKGKSKAPEESIPSFVETTQEVDDDSDRNQIDISRFDASVMNLNEFIARFKSRFKPRPQMPFRIGKR